MAVSATIVVRSALSVLLEEVKCEGMRGNAETVLEMFETVMLSLKPNDDAFHKQVIDRSSGTKLLWLRVHCAHVPASGLARAEGGRQHPADRVECSRARWHTRTRSMPGDCCRCPYPATAPCHHQGVCRLQIVTRDVSWCSSVAVSLCLRACVCVTRR